MRNGFFSSLFRFFGGVIYFAFLRFLVLTRFLPLLFRRSSSIAPKMRCCTGGSGWQWRLPPSLGACALNRLQIHQNGVHCFLFRNDDGNTWQHLWGLVDVPGNIQNGFSSVLVCLTHVDTLYSWKCARGARAKLLRWELWICTVVLYYWISSKSLSSLEINLSLGRSF